MVLTVPRDFFATFVPVSILGVSILFRYQLGVMPRTRNKFVEIVATAECYLIITYVKKNKESKKQPFRICLPVKLAMKNINEEGK